MVWSVADTWGASVVYQKLAATSIFFLLWLERANLGARRGEATIQTIFYHICLTLQTVCVNILLVKSPLDSTWGKKINMSTDKEPKPKYSETTQQNGANLYAWLYRQVAEGYKVDVDEVRSRVENDDDISYEEMRAPYGVALQLNEDHRAQLPSEISEDAFSSQVGVHEDIAFLLWDAETALAHDLGLI